MSGRPLTVVSEADDARDEATATAAELREYVNRVTHISARLYKLAAIEGDPVVKRGAAEIFDLTQRLARQTDPKDAA